MYIYICTFVNRMRFVFACKFLEETVSSESQPPTAAGASWEVTIHCGFRVEGLGFGATELHMGIAPASPTPSTS